jgi:hypothetical protein
VDLVFAERILGTQGVTEITVFDSRINPQTRTYSATITVNTIYGTDFQVNIFGGGSHLAVVLQGGE